MVEWKKIWEVTIWDKRFNGVENHMQPQVIKYHYYLANELSELERNNGNIRILYTTDRVAFADDSEVDKNVSEGEVVTIPWGGNVSIKYYKGKFITADNRIATSNDTNLLSNKFLYYWMVSQKDLIGSFYRGAGIKHPSMLSVLNMDIPVPSLSEQSRIVSILDTFTDSIDNLKQQIEHRRKQYEHYRDQLLDFEGKEGAESRTIQSVCKKICSGGTPLTSNKSYYNGNIPWLRTQEVDWKDIYDTEIKITEEAISNSSAKIIPVNCVIVAMYGATAAKSAINKIPLSTNQACCNLEIDKDKALYKYVYQWLCKEYQNLKSMGEGSQNNINTKKIKDYLILLPSLEEQSRIVSILDTFEASIANLEEQLKLREKQYEYYRNRLLTFE